MNLQGKVSGEPGISIGYCRFTQFNVKNCVPNDAVYTIHLSCTKGYFVIQHQRLISSLCVSYTHVHTHTYFCKFLC